MSIPSFLTNMALFYQGSPRTTFEEVSFPTFKRKVVTKRLPGTSHPQSFDMGPEGAMEMTFTGSELDDEILANFGLCVGESGVRVHLKSTFKKASGCDLILHEVKATGFWEEVSLGTQKIEEESSRSYKLTCNYFEYWKDGTLIKKIDANAPEEAERKLLGL